MFSDEPADTVNDSNDQLTANSTPDGCSEPPKQRILIGSQRNPDAYRPKNTLNGENEQFAPETGHPETEKKPVLKTGQVVFALETAKDETQPKASEPLPVSDRQQDGHDQRPERQNQRREGMQKDGKPAESRDAQHKGRGDRRRHGEDEMEGESLQNQKFVVPLRSPINIPTPSIRGDLTDDLQEEFEAMFGSNELDSYMSNVDDTVAQGQLETDTKRQGKVLSIGKESVFIEFGGREQGALPLKLFKENPNVGDQFEVIVVRFLQEEGLYELSMPLAAADVKDWSQVELDMVVEARVTGHNTGGLECEVNRLRGFIPMSQISMFRVEKPEEFVGQKLMCVVTECNPMRRNLVLSHRSLLEREREENRQKLLDELAVGQIREGLVRKVIDVGAFVDLGGVDGFVPISALAWGRVKHPTDVISEGQKIKVTVAKIDLDKNRISLSYRDDATNPWRNIHSMFPEKSTARGKISKIMDFGAFVELMPGVEGLVHISELSHKRVMRVSDAVKEGDWVDVFIRSIDTEKRQISLSIKELQAAPQPESQPEETKAVEPKVPEVEAIKHKQKHKGPLRGGVGGQSDGEKFGLKF